MIFSFLFFLIQVVEWILLCGFGAWTVGHSEIGQLDNRDGPLGLVRRSVNTTVSKVEHDRTRFLDSIN